MAEYSEVIKQFKRMCWYYSSDKRQKNCPICTSYPNCNIGQCRKIAFEQPECFNDVVMAWAAEHPEPVYPTWYEWLTSIGAVTRKVKPDVASTLIETGLLDPIPADMAEKLGVKPKEGT